jgi:hypothetical protein
MAIDFPDSPSVDDQHTVGDRIWRWTGVYWELTSTSSLFTASDTAPSSPTAGDIWFESSTGKTYIRYDSYWIEIGAASSYTDLIFDADGDTSVQVEASADEDVIRFTTAGTERANVSASGFNIAGDLDVTGNLTVGLNTDVEASIDAVEADVSTLQTDVTNINELQFSYQTASYTLVLSDAGKAVQMAVASANNLTVPPNSSVAFPVGTQILVIQQGAGQTTIVAGAGVTLYSKDSNLKLSAPWCAATLIKANTDVWVILGDLSA